MTRQVDAPERGQALVLEALVLGMVLIFLLLVSALVAAERAGTQAGAGGAALACAGAADLWTVVESRETVHAGRVAVSATRGAAAARPAWGANVLGCPSSTLGWAGRVGRAECSFHASVGAVLPLWGLLGPGSGRAWQLLAAARAVPPTRAGAAVAADA